MLRKIVIKCDFQSTEISNNTALSVAIVSLRVITPPFSPLLFCQILASLKYTNVNTN